MTTTKMTTRAIKALKPIALAYCELQGILYFLDPIYYTADVYGWRQDTYEVDGCFVSTGYAPVGKRPDRENILSAQKEMDSFEGSWKERKEKAKQILVALYKATM